MATKKICIGPSSPIFGLGGVDADGSGLIDYTEFLAATLDKYLRRNQNPDIFFADVPCCQLFGFKLQKKNVRAVKRCQEVGAGKLRKCYLQEDVCYTAFSPKPQFLSSRVLFFSGKNIQKKTDSAPTKRGVFDQDGDGHITLEARSCTELHLQTGFDKSPWLWCDPNCKELKKILENGSVDEAE